MEDGLTVRGERGYQEFCKLESNEAIVTQFLLPEGTNIQEYVKEEKTFHIKEAIIALRSHYIENIEGKDRVGPIVFTSHHENGNENAYVPIVAVFFEKGEKLYCVADYHQHKIVTNITKGETPWVKYWENGMQAKSLAFTKKKGLYKKLKEKNNKDFLLFVIKGMANVFDNTVKTYQKKDMS